MKSCSSSIYTAFGSTTDGVSCVNNLAHYLFFVNVSFGMSPEHFIHLGRTIKATELIYMVKFIKCVSSVKKILEKSQTFFFFFFSRNSKLFSLIQFL